jgi:hypothetical protein
MEMYGSWRGNRDMGMLGCEKGHNVVYFLLGDSPAPVLQMPMFRNILSVPSSQASKYELYLLAYEDGTDRVFRNVSV